MLRLSGLKRVPLPALAATVFVATGLVTYVVCRLLGPSRDEMWIEGVLEGQRASLDPSPSNASSHVRLILRLLDEAIDPTNASLPASAFAMSKADEMVWRGAREAGTEYDVVRDKLLELCESRNPRARRVAVALLLHWREETKVRKALAAALRDEDWRVREAAVTSIPYLPGAEGKARDAARDGSTGVRRRLVEKLATWRPAHVEELLAAIVRRDSHATVREGAVRAIRVTREETITLLVSVATDDPDAYVCAAAIETLQETSDPSLRATALRKLDAARSRLRPPLQLLLPQEGNQDVE